MCAAYRNLRFRYYSRVYLYSIMKENVRIAENQMLFVSVELRKIKLTRMKEGLYGQMSNNPSFF